MPITRHRPSHTRPTDARNLGYRPGNPDDWTDELPTDIQLGLDGLAATGTGDVVGPGSAVDNQLARFDGATGKLIQASVVTVTDSGIMQNLLQPRIDGDIYDNTTGLRKLAFSHGASNVNYPQLGSNVTGAGILFTAASTVDTDIDTRFKGLGTGLIQLESPTRIGGGAADDKLFFRDSAIFLHSPADGDLDIEADDKINLNVSGSTDGVTIEMGGVEKARFHPTDGALLFGITTPLTDAIIHSAKQDANHTLVLQVARGATAKNNFIDFMASRGTLASPTAIAANDATGFIRWQQYNGSAWVTRVRYIGQATGANAAKLAFATGNAGLVTAFEVLENQALRMSTDNNLQFRSALQYVNSPSTGRMRIGADTDMQFYTGATLRMQLDDDQLAFNAGGTNPTLSWGAGAGILEINSGGNLMMSFQTSFINVLKPLWISDSLVLAQEAADPTEPASGRSVMWASDGTGYGAAGDIIMASNVGGTTKKAIIFTYATGAAW
jgi:hypothetical protein